MASAAEPALEVVDWRRRTHDLYRTAREASDPHEGHRRWREGRDDLFAHHPASPLLPEHRTGFTGLAVAPYDERYRFEVPVEPVDDADGGPDPLRGHHGHGRRGARTSGSACCASRRRTAG